MTPWLYWTFSFSSLFNTSSRTVVGQYFCRFVVYSLSRRRNKSFFFQTFLCFCLWTELFAIFDNGVCFERSSPTSRLAQGGSYDSHVIDDDELGSPPSIVFGGCPPPSSELYAVTIEIRKIDLNRQYNARLSFQCATYWWKKIIILALNLFTSIIRLFAVICKL